jgi:hypothetical protein
MSKGGNQITITVSRSGSAWTFSGADDARGNLVVAGKGAVQIYFRRATGETWEFKTPHITFGEYGSAKDRDRINGVLEPVGNGKPTEVHIIDTNTQGEGTAGFYAYSLHTNDGVIDPMIVNNGGP